jgi:hypothetical protein
MKTLMNRLFTSTVLLLLLLLCLFVFVARADKQNANSKASSRLLLRGAPDDLENPFACSLAAADEDSCTSAQDDDGNPCVWCQFAQAGGACVSSEQASEISNVVPQVTCSNDDTTTTSSISSSNPVDVNCLAAGMGNQDDAQTVCDGTVDANGYPCVWCDVAGSGYGVCLSSNAADAAGQYLTCHDNRITSSPWDPTCIMASFTQGADKDSCEASMDQEGSACVWCRDGNANTNTHMGLCMTLDQSSVASQWLTCDDSPSSEDNALIQEHAIMDPSCLVVVGYEGGGNEDACHSTDDENGNACVWCNGPNDVGICLNSDQAAMAGQWLTCDDAAATIALEEKEMQSPLDPTCIEAGLQGDKDSCEATQDQDGNTCVWCEGGDASTGLCLNSEQASMASQWLTCDDITSLVSEDSEDDHVTSSPTDPTCVAAGYQAEDAEATCHTTNDADGNACVWCTGPSPNMGVCLSADQASIAGRWLSCDDAMDEIEASMS